MVQIWIRFSLEYVAQNISVFLPICFKCPYSKYHVPEIPNGGFQYVLAGVDGSDASHNPEIQTMFCFLRKEY